MDRMKEGVKEFIDRRDATGASRPPESISSWCRAGTFHMGDLFPAFRVIARSARVSLYQLFFKELIQNYQYAKVAYLGVACQDNPISFLKV